MPERDRCRTREEHIRQPRQADPCSTFYWKRKLLIVILLNLCSSHCDCLTSIVGLGIPFGVFGVILLEFSTHSLLVWTSLRCTRIGGFGVSFRL